MATEQNLRSISLDADASLAGYTGVPGLPGSANPNYGKQYRFVKVTGVNTVGLATANTDPVIGVMQNKPQETGAAATVAYEGVSLVIAGGTVTAGEFVMPKTTDGTAVTRTSTNTIAGTALTSGASGELISVLLV